MSAGAVPSRVVTSTQVLPRSRLLVGVTGFKRSGKDTFASRLVQAHGFQQLALAAPLKEMALALNPIIPNGKAATRLRDLVSSEGWEDAKAVPEVRRFLQALGTEAMRAQDPNFWIRQCFRHVTDAPTVISDVRFPNEANHIRRAGGVIVRIVREKNSDPHPSEAGQLEIIPDATIHNSGSLRHLALSADKFMSFYKKGENTWQL